MAQTTADVTSNGTEKGGYRLDTSNWNQLGDGQVQTHGFELVRWEENQVQGTLQRVAPVTFSAEDWKTPGKV